MPNESHTTHVDSRKRATTPATSTEPSPRPDLRPMKLEAALRADLIKLDLVLLLYELVEQIEEAGFAAVADVVDVPQP